MISSVWETREDKNDGISETVNNTSLDKLLYTAGICTKDEKDLSQTNLCQTPDVTGDLENRTEETEGGSLKFMGTKHDGEICDLWLDACQFLTDEENGGAIFDKCGRSLSSCPPSEVDPDQTKASGLPGGENISTDQSTENWKQFPPIERWFSSDSWSSALSDWIQTVSTYSENSFTSTDNPSADTKPGMAIQDTTVEQRTSPDITNTGLTCVSLNLQEPDADETLDRRLDKSDNTNGTLFKQRDKDLSSQPDSDVVTGNKVELSELLVECESSTTEMRAAEETLNAKLCCEEFRSEFRCQHISGELWAVKLKVDALVTGDKQEQEGHSGAEKISDYTSDKNQTSDADLHTHPIPSSGHVSSEVEHLKHTQGVKTDEKCVSCSVMEENGSYEGFNTKDFIVKPEESTNTTPEFISVTPLSTGNTVLHYGVFKRADADVPHPENTINEISFKQTAESDEKSINNEDSSKDLTCSDPSSSYGNSDGHSVRNSRRKEYSNTCNISKELSGERCMVSEDKHVAYVTLDKPRDFNLLSFPNQVNSETQNCSCVVQPKRGKMPHKTSKTSLEGKANKLADQQHEVHAFKMQEKPSSQESREFTSDAAACEDCVATVVETVIITEKITPKAHGKRKKKKQQIQHRTAKSLTDPPAEARNRTSQKSTTSKTENLDVKVLSNLLDKPASTKLDHVNVNSLKTMSVRSRKASGGIVTKMIQVNTDTSQENISVKPEADTCGINVSKMENETCSSDPQSTCLSGSLNKDIKRRRIANDPPGTILIKTRPQLPAIFHPARKDEDGTRRAYSEVVEQKATAPIEVVVPHVVLEIQAEPVPADPQNILLWCRFSPVPPDATIKWTKEGTVLSESRKGEAEDERSTLTVLKASSKDLGLYKCSLSISSICVCTSEYHLTSEVLLKLVIPSHDQPEHPDEENIHCSPLLFRGDFLSDQYFGEIRPASIITEKVHFGEGMHRRAFRTTLRAGKLPRFNPGHPCVLKVHNTAGYGTKTNEELIRKNYSLAVEECQVQNTARQYLKAYHSVARSAESFGEVPEIIPIYLVHRPSNDIPYATLEEELLGEFVKYSMKDGREINLMCRNSEAGQKCCAFQHWVFTQTEGNLLVTDMQGVGMKLTDVGIATCKKGYKGFRGNCATSFIDQFKALHQCNRYCELSGLKSLQLKRTVPSKPATQPAARRASAARRSSALC